LKRKIVSDYKKAIDQCAEVDPSKTRKWFLFLCIDVDSDIACVPSNIPDLDRFIKEMSTDQCEIAYESGIWANRTVENSRTTVKQASRGQAEPEGENV